MKWLIRILIVLAVLILGLLWFGYSKIDDLLKIGIEKGGSEALRVPVKLEKASVSVFSGAGSLEGLEIGTPAGFSTPKTLRIGKTEVAIDTAASKEDRIVIKHIRLIEPDIHLELGPGGTNLTRSPTTHAPPPMPSRPLLQRPARPPLPPIRSRT
jgi:uncharacterized protein involved in outer membrane biogenesis